MTDRHAVNRVDVYVIDAEGSDYVVIKQIDLNISPPVLIVFETIHLSRADKTACYDLLESAGYQIIEDGNSSRKVFPEFQTFHSSFSD